jgi:hypothetical protein
MVVPDHSLYHLAAGGGHLNVLQYLHENGFPWDEGTCQSAAEGDHGCPWDERTCWFAECQGHADVLRWAIDNGCHEPDGDGYYNDKKNSLLF